MTSLAAHERIDPQEVIELTRTLVRFDTVNPPGNEEPAVRALGSYLQQAGLEVAYQTVEPGRTNLIAHLAGNRRTDRLVLCGHMDVVHPGTQPWQHGPFAAERVGSRIVGRGTVDMKGGVAAMAVALTTLARAGFRPHSDLVLAVTVGEEDGMEGVRHLAKSGALDGSPYLVVGEPTALEVKIAEKGLAVWRVVAHGRPAHGSMPQLGVNAITYMAHLIVALQGQPFPFTGSALLGEPTISPNLIAGGVKSNVVPDRCELILDMRTVPGQTQEALLEQMRALLAEVADRTGLAVRVEVEALRSVPSVATPAEDPLVRAMVEAVTAARGVAPTVGGVPYGTDGATLAPAIGASLVICGPGQPGQAHQTDEHVEVAERVQAAAAYTALAERLLG